MITLTTEWIEKGMHNGIGIRRSQCEILGIPYPPAKGWKQTLVGKEVTDTQLVRFIELGLTPNKKPKSSIKDKKLKTVIKDKKIKQSLYSRPEEINAYQVEPKSFFDLEPIPEQKTDLN